MEEMVLNWSLGHETVRIERDWGFLIFVLIHFLDITLNFFEWYFILETH